MSLQGLPLPNEKDSYIPQKTKFVKKKMKNTCNLDQKGVFSLIRIYTSEGNTSEGKGTVYARR